MNLPSIIGLICCSTYSITMTDYCRESEEGMRKTSTNTIYTKEHHSLISVFYCLLHLVMPALPFSSSGLHATLHFLLLVSMFK